MTDTPVHLYPAIEVSERPENHPEAFPYIILWAPDLEEVVYGDEYVVWVWNN